MFHPNMLTYIGLDFAQIIAVGTFESGLLATLVAKVTYQILFPRKDTPAIRIRTRNLDWLHTLQSFSGIGCPVRGFFIWKSNDSLAIKCSSKLVRKGRVCAANCSWNLEREKCHCVHKITDNYFKTKSFPCRFFSSFFLKLKTQFLRSLNIQDHIRYIILYLD